MFVFLSKLLPLLIYPLGLACIFILVVLFSPRLPAWRRAALAAAVLLLFFGGNRWVAMSLARGLEWRYLPQADPPQAEVAVILGGGTLSADYPRINVEMNSAGDRVLYAAQLYREGKVKTLLLSGGFLGWTDQESSPAEDMAVLLGDLGVPQGAIWLEPDSRNTYENAVLSAKILKKNAVNSILLVTSAWHMHRAVKLFEAQGLEVIPVPVDYTVTEAGWERLRTADWKTQLIGLLPSADSLSLTTMMLKEYIGIWVYQIRGWQ